MKKLSGILFMLMGLGAYAQEVIVNQSGNSLVNVTQISIIPGNSTLVTQTTKTHASARQSTTKEAVCWLETGTGFYSTDPAVVHNVTTNQTHRPFLMATMLYDTSGGVNRPHPSWTDSKTMTLISGPKEDAGMQLIRSDVGVDLRSNIESVVPGDTMLFALTYKVKIGDNKNDGKALPSKKYKLYFFYNNTPTFIELKDDAEMAPFLPSVRLHFDEEPFQPEASELSEPLADALEFDNYLAFKVEVSTEKNFERTIFITLVPNKKLDYGSSGSVYAVLKDDDGRVIATDILKDMSFAPAHDPNYMQQWPSCLELPKKRTPFKYRVHFQNTGEGAAKQVRLQVQLPEGMDWSTLKFTAANFAGNVYDSSWLDVRKDPANNTMSVEFISRNSDLLMGRTVADPATNKLTMGDLYFTMDATTAVKDSMGAYAQIYFLSQYPQVDSVYEEPVKTNIAVSRYQKCCADCPPAPVPDPKECVSCCLTPSLWWWWLPFIVIFILLIIIIARTGRKKTCG